jgi:hypothetical protein
MNSISLNPIHYRSILGSNELGLLEDFLITIQMQCIIKGACLSQPSLKLSYFSPSHSCAHMWINHRGTNE